MKHNRQTRFKRQIRDLSDRLWSHNASKLFAKVGFRHGISLYILIIGGRLWVLIRYIPPLFYINSDCL